LTERYRRPVTIYLPPAALEALGRRASSEARTKSKMGELLLVDALGVPDGGEERAGARGRSARRPAAKAVAARSSAPSRTGPCAHRIPPDAFCARCD
jgi:hypothetical protein